MSRDDMIADYLARGGQVKKLPEGPPPKRRKPARRNRWKASKSFRRADGCRDGSH